VQVAGRLAPEVEREATHLQRAPAERGRSTLLRASLLGIALEVLCFGTLFLLWRAIAS